MEPRNSRTWSATSLLLLLLLLLRRLATSWSPWS